MATLFVKEYKLSDKLKEEIVSQGTLKNFKTEEVLIHEGSYIKILPVVLQGSLRAMLTNVGDKEILMSYIQKSETCIQLYLSGIYKEKAK